jgi:excinuclease ABC subunit C
MTPQGVEAGKYQLCLEYHIGNCKAPCVGNQTESEYNESIRQIRHILKGNLSEVKNHLKELMIESASRLAFEEAQKYKDRLDLLDKYQSRSTIVSPTVGDVEVYSISSTEKLAFVNFLRVHQGIIVISRNVEIRKKLEEPDQEILLHVIGAMRSHYGDGCREIICLQPIEWPEYNVVVTQPKAGDKRKLLELSHKNAMLYRQEKLNQYEKLNPAIRVDRLMEQMQQDLRLRDQPRHIECFDNSNIQGNFPVAAMTVFKNLKPSKKDYRHFNIKTVEGPDDFASMEEVVYRRYKRAVDENEALPQLIVIDGGKGQLSSAVYSLQQLGLIGKVTIVGIAKKLEEIYFPGDSVPLYIDKKSESLKIIQQIRDEAHRFGITHHRNKRSKGTIKTGLTEIPGIGEALSTELLRVFKSVKKIKEAEESEIAQIVGPAKAKVIFDFFKS